MSLASRVTRISRVIRSLCTRASRFQHRNLNQTHWVFIEIFLYETQYVGVTGQGFYVPAIKHTYCWRDMFGLQSYIDP